jgi:hypothetical protein
VLRTGARVFTGQEVDLNFDSVSVHNDRAMVDEWLPRICLVPPASKEFLDRSVPRLLKVSMVQGQVDIDAADVRRRAGRKEELRNPATDVIVVVSVFTQQAHKLQ